MIKIVGQNKKEKHSKKVVLVIGTSKTSNKWVSLFQDEKLNSWSPTTSSIVIFMYKS